jgi:quercetin dioxygenase-like cupin family protein
MKRRQFLQLTGAMLAASTSSQTARPQTSGAGPRPTEILRGDLIGQDQKVTETLVTVVAFPPGAISCWHVHPGAQELVFGLEGRLTLEIEGLGSQTLSEGESSLVPSDVPHTVRNEAVGEPARILVVYSRSDKDKPLRIDVNRST